MELMPQSESSLEVQYASLAQRVTGVESHLASISGQLSGLAQSLNERSRTPWGIIFGGATFLLTVITVIGGVIAWGLLSQSESIVKFMDFQNSSIVKSMDEFRSAYENNRIVSRNDNNDRFGAVNQSIASLQANLVTRNEWSERNLSRDHDIDNLRGAQIRGDEDLQRQVDLIRSDFNTLANSLGNGRDFIQRLEKSYDRLAEQFAEFRSQSYRENTYGR